MNGYLPARQKGSHEVERGANSITDRNNGLSRHVQERHRDHVGEEQAVGFG